jgi:hypothetical protein
MKLIKTVSAKTHSAYRDNLDKHSNRTEERDLHPSEHDSYMTSIAAGMMKSIKPVSQNARSRVLGHIDHHSSLVEEPDFEKYRGVKKFG